MGLPTDRDTAARSKREPARGAPLRARRFETTLARLLAEVRREPGRAALRLRLASLYLRTGRFERAVSELAAGARLLLEAGETRRADAVLARLLGLSSADADLHLDLGRACRKAGLPDTAARCTLRAAELLQSSGRARAARVALEESTRDAPQLTSDALRELSAGWAAFGLAERAAELAVLSAERQRREGKLEGALELCRSAATLSPRAAGLHRAWGLTLLEQDDPDSACGHLLRWRAASPRDLDAAIWCAEALWSSEHVEEALVAVLHVGRVLGLGRNLRLPSTELGRRITKHLRDGGDTLAPQRLAPFWEAEELVGSPANSAVASAADVAEAALLAQPAPDAAPAVTSASGAAARPRIFLGEDTSFFRVRLSEILAREGFEVLAPEPGRSLAEALASPPPQLDLLILPVHPASEESFGLLRAVRANPALAKLPILGVTPLNRSGLDLDALRALGIVGFVDKRTIPELLTFRINAIVRPGLACKRRFERAPSFFPVDLDADGCLSSEYGLNLSCGGLALASARPLDADTRVTLRFHLPPPRDVLIEVRGRVVRCARERDEASPYRLGICFETLDARVHELIDGAVRDLLAATL